MPDLSRTILIDVPVDRFYALIIDFDRYPEFLNDVDSTTIVHATENQWDVKFTVHVIRRVEYTLRLKGVENKSLEWSLASGQLFKTNNGGWQLEDENGKTRATYTIDLSVNRFVPKAIINRLVEFTFPTMLKQWKERAESLYRAENNS